MAENEQGQKRQQSQGQGREMGGQQPQGQSREMGGQQSQGQTSQNRGRQNMERQSVGRSQGMTRRGLLAPSSLFSVSPFSLLATSPFELIRQFTQEIEQLSDESTASGSTAMQRGTAGNIQQRGGADLEQEFFAPQVDVVERDGQLVIRADLPGVNKDDVRVEVTDDSVIIEGERRYEHEENQGGVYRVERSYGRFLRQIPLPEGVNPENASANFRNGVLEITMPAPQAASRNRQLEIRDEGQGGQSAQAQGASAGGKS